jgi:iron-sulfur cluster insertion protein
MINITESAVIKIKDILAEENNNSLKLRMFVQGGGCSGFSYGFTLDEDINEDDFDIEKDGIHVLVDAISSQYLTGATVDYSEDLNGSQFTVKNPNDQSTCGCGSSFSV